MKQYIILEIKYNNNIIYGGTFFGCTYTIEAIENEDKKVLHIFKGDDSVYCNSSKYIEAREYFDNISNTKEITITVGFND